MNIFDFRDQLVGDYASYIKSFEQEKLQEGVLWPELSSIVENTVSS